MNCSGTSTGFENGLEQACEYLMKRLDEESQTSRFGALVDAYEREHFDGWSKSYRTKWAWVYQCRRGTPRCDHSADGWRLLGQLDARQG